MTVIINATQHQATPAQVQAGVIELPLAMQEQLVELLNFTTLPSAKDIDNKAMAIAKLLVIARRKFGADYVMIGGAPYLMPLLVKRIRQCACPTPIFAYSERVSEESMDTEGNVVKRNVFKHLGFVEALA
jgi:hypothetical protein